MSLLADARTSALVLSSISSAVWVTFGHTNRGEYVKVGSTEGLSKPGVIFRYASYVREQEALLGYYLDCYHENLHGLVTTQKRDHTISRTDGTSPAVDNRILTKSIVGE